jgi:hypothetical protein
MKNKNFKTVGLSFLLGTFAATAFFAMSGFTNGDSNKQASQTTVTATQANELFKAYYMEATPLSESLKGICVDMAQYNSMTSLLDGGAEQPTAFRIYFGKSAEGDKYGMVVGVNAEGKDMTDKSIYRSAQGSLGPCPNTCDATSSITAD